MIVIAIQHSGSEYSEFNQCGIFIGTRDHLGETFSFLNQDNDQDIAKMVFDLNCRSIYYDVPDDQLAEFYQHYGYGIEPSDRMTLVRTIFVTDEEDGPSRMVEYIAG